MSFSRLASLGIRSFADVVPKYNDPLTTQDERNIILDNIRGLNSVDTISFHLPVFAVDNFDLVHQSSLALDRIDSKRATRPLLKILRHSPWWHSRMFVAATLMQLRDKRAIFPLIDVLETSPKTRGCATERRRRSLSSFTSGPITLFQPYFGLPAMRQPGFVGLLHLPLAMPMTLA